ncbi:MAG: SgcJ/EcaC family oxidoreductase [Rhodobacteraceae bacterium]|nr:SgcJ/EcaC family oxidoreductase [Paracoccaceae bacterium]
MSLPSPDAFPRAFANAWATRDAAEIAALFAEDADFLSLTGAWAEGRKGISDLLGAELSGAFARAKLVTGRGKQRPLAPGATMILQRFVLSGIVDANGRDAGRIGAVLSAVLVESSGRWQVAAAQFSVEG